MHSSIWMGSAGVLASALALISSCAVDETNRNEDGSGASGAGTTTSNGGSGGGNGGSGATGANGGNGGSMGPGFSCEPSSGSAPTISTEQVTSDVERPVQLKSPPGRPDTLFIVEQTGRIRIFENGAVLPQAFLDVSGMIRGGDTEEGLLGLAFHPQYQENGRFFIHYSQAGDGASTIVEYVRSDDDPNRANGTAVRTVLQHTTAQSNHNGGAVEFGNDGFLYISMGDGGNQHDPECDSVNSANLLGKIMRIDVDGTPDGNGYPAAPGNPNDAKWYHLGMRNPWRMSFDACTGDLYIGDVGQDTWEEVNVATQAAGPLDFGWPFREGAHDHSTICTPTGAPHIEPVADYQHDIGGVGCTSNPSISTGAVAGGVVYRGSQFPQLRGWYIYGDVCTGKTWMLKTEDGVVTQPAVQTAVLVPGVSDYGIDGNGEVYLLSLASGGSVSHIVAQ